MRPPQAVAEEKSAASQINSIEAVQVFPLCTLFKRSPTLDGSLPVRAAQGCKPVLDGNSAGVHVRLDETALLERTSAEPVLRFTDEAYEAATARYEEKLEHIVTLGLLPRGGYWHQELKNGFVSLQGNRIRLWTGFLVRPEPGTAILLTRAYNRRAWVDCADALIVENSGYVPLVLDFDMATVQEDQTWLDTELACLLPLQAGCAITPSSLRDRPDIGRTLLDFYTGEYLERRSEAKYAGRYRQMTAKETRDAHAAPECHVVSCGAPDICNIGQHHRFLTDGGEVYSHDSAAAFSYGVLRSVCEVTGRWDGLNVRDIVCDMPEVSGALEREWTDLFGPGSLESLDWWAAYALPLLGPHRAEPFISLTSLALGQTSAGWSTVIDSITYPNMDGMRGVISTDTFPMLPAPFWFLDRARFHVPENAPIARVMPIPRRLLTAGVAIRPLEELAPEV